ncbi:MAG: polyprenyl synthetase family protein [Spirochaetia bacterium]|nr:polyprenyl synthetase family protein [Spirochaetia bacterium]
MNKKEFIAKIDQKMGQILKDDLKILSKIKKFVIKSGGKRVRPVIHYYFTEMLGYKGKNWQDIGAVGELIHAASLLHDDVIDDSERRRGQPTLHALYNNKTAILAGDYLLGCAFDHLRTLGQNNEFFGIFTSVVRMLSAGELLQMQWQSNLKIPEKVYDRIIFCKTASLFGAMVASSAVLCGLDAQTADKYRQFGETMGRIFQIRDDYLDYFTPPSVTGKPAFQDFERGIVTRPVILMQKKLGSSDKITLKKIWSSDDMRKSEEGKVVLKTLLLKSGIQNKMEAEIEEGIHSLMHFVRQHDVSPIREKILENLNELMIPKS